MLTVCRTTLWGLFALSAAVAAAQDYPNRPVRIIVSEAGSSPDIVARTIGQGIAGPLGQPVIIDNRRPLLIPEIISRATADGYTVALGGTTFWTGALLHKKSYDPVKELAPITLVTTSPSILAVHPSVAVKSVRDLIDLAKNRPATLNYAQGPPGGGVHLAGVLFKTMAGIDMVFVPYTSAALGVNATIAGETHLLIYSTVALTAHIKSGRLRGVAVTSLEPTALAANLPTVAATGLPGYEYVSTLGVFAPAGTPAVAINRLHGEIVRVITRPDAKERFFNLGADVVGSTPAQFMTRTKAELALWTKVMRDAGLQPE